MGLYPAEHFCEDLGKVEDEFVSVFENVGTAPDANGLNQLVVDFTDIVYNVADGIFGKSITVKNAVETVETAAVDDK